VREVRLGQYRPGVARVVVDLTAAAPYQIQREGNTLVIYFDSPADATQAKPLFHYAEAAPRGAEHHQAALMNVVAPRFALPSETDEPHRDSGFF